MKQNRAFSTLLFGNLAREKRLGLAALALLFLSVGLLVLSQRPWRLPGDGPGAQVGQAPTPNTGTQAGQTPAPATGIGTTPGAPTAQNPAPPTETPEVAPPTLAYPLRGDSLIAQAFHSIDTAYGDLRYYDGVAWHASPGEAVRAAAKGRVRQIAQSPGEGLQIWVDHGGGMVTRYGGLAMALVTEGAQVTDGQVIGEVGPPSQIRERTGPTLSFAVTLNGASIDPNLYLRK
ncbi:MAG TPA: peptidoglycan DD-metalloendopeptidase family protein [Symbiobacteriaceae bacterium]|nr:peptidoglycan DD-metalloendopeptidase family protein [Symbiobacteriaceae bacterium]